jgi:hypothetical protein
MEAGVSPEQRVLAALVEGYAARAGLKERLRSLNEWEIARRAGYTELSYAEYLEDPLREQVATVLSALQTQGLASLQERGPKYDTFAPTELGILTADRVTADGNGTAPPAESNAAPRESPSEAREPDPVLERLDEIIRLLRNIEGRLGGAT